MTIFKYKTIDQAGNPAEGVIEASNGDSAARKLLAKKLTPVKIVENKASSSGKGRFAVKPRVKQDDIIVFTRQLVTLLKAGVPLLSALDALAEQTENDDMHDVISSLYKNIENGKSLSEALQKHSNVFSELYISSVRAGEMGGALDDILVRMAELMEYDRETKARIKAAMRYPVIVVISLVVAFIALMMLVVPKFIDMFSKLGVDLPLPTKILIGLHALISGYWPYLLALVILTAVALRFWLKTERGTFVWDGIKLKLPVFGPLVLKTAMSRFTRMLETLNKSGLPILRSLEIVSTTVGNVVVGKEILKAGVGIRKGEGIAVPLRRSTFFPPMVIRMISIGEQSGSLDDMLRNVSNHYEMEVEYAVKNLSTLIEPILTVVLGGIVLFLALAIFLPMWDLTKIAG